MRSVRIFSTAELISGEVAELRGTPARHVSQVLRMRPGQDLVLFDGHGSEFLGVIEHCAKDSVRVALGAMHTPTVESGLDLTLWHGVCSSARMDSVVQKATELGVHRILPVLTARGVVKLDSKRADKKLEHWRRIAISACEQSGRNRVPEVLEPVPLLAALNTLTPEHMAIMLHPSGGASLPQLVQRTAPIILCTGPEGGFTDDELAVAVTAGFQLARLGPRVLRTETAPVVALGIVQLLAGDLG